MYKSGEINYTAMKFPKESWKGSSRERESQKKGRAKKRNRKEQVKVERQSILHTKASGFCYLCALLDGDYSCKRTEEHHVVFGSGQRKLSHKYGLMVYLCKEHHTIGPFAPHNNQEVREMLCRIAQERFEQRNSNVKWLDVFEKNYL